MVISALIYAERKKGRQQQHTILSNCNNHKYSAKNLSKTVFDGEWNSTVYAIKNTTQQID